MPEAHSMLIDRAHRIGPSRPNKTRPIVVKFHYFGEREAVRTGSYDKTETLPDVLRLAKLFRVINHS